MNKTTLTISEGTRKIGGILTEIEEIVIPEGVTCIGGLAFYSCSSLKSIFIDKEKGSLDISKTGIPETTKVYWRGEFIGEE